MSTPAWLNDHQPFIGGENGAFNPSTNPNMAYMATSPSNNFDLNQLQQQQQRQLQQARQLQMQQQQQQQIQNGAMRHASPTFHNSVYNTNQLIPSKRPRPREDGLATSPRQAPGGVPISRSQTPQGGVYPGYQGTMNGAQNFQPGPQNPQVFNVNGTAAPSPMLQHQQAFDPSMAPPRVQNMSPAMFSPTPHSFGSQPSPVHSEHASRNGTPQNGGAAYGPGGNFPSTPTQPFNQPANPVLNASMNAPMTNVNGTGVMHPHSQMQSNMSPSQQQDRMEAIRRQSMLRQMQANNMQKRPMFGQPVNAASQMNPYQQQQMAARQQQQRSQQAMQQGNAAENFVRQVHAIMQSKGLSFTPHLAVLGRQISPYALFMVVLQMGLSKKLTTLQGWGALAEKMGFAPNQVPQAAHEIQLYYENNLGTYEAYYIQQKQQAAVMAQRAQQMTGAQKPNGIPPQAAARFSPGKPPFGTHPVTPSRPVPMQQAPLGNRGPVGLQQNGHLSPQQRPPNLGSQLPPNAVPPGRRKMPPGPSRRLQPQAQSQGEHASGGPLMSREPRGSFAATVSCSHGGDCERLPLPIVPPRSPVFKPFIVQPATSMPVVHNGMRTGLKDDDRLWGKVTDLLKVRPVVPEPEDLGSVNLRAVSLSLKSGIPGEIKVALDTLLVISYTRMHHPLQLELCEDLLENLIECAEDQINLLADNAPEISDAMLLTNYEDIIRGARNETWHLQDIHEPGSLAYDLDRAVKRLLAVTSILRNLSDDERGSRVSERPDRLTETLVIEFFTSAIRSLGTRSMLLRTHQATADFSKDVVTFFSNISHKIELPGREDALCILSFLLSFAPCPSPYTNSAISSPSPRSETEFASSPQLCFSRYVSKKHRYYPEAINCLAKLLAKDDPNRTHYRALFLAESTATTNTSSGGPPNDLITRAFGLCIAGLPDVLDPKFQTLIRERASFVAQGLLAAEILTTLIPPSTTTSTTTTTSSEPVTGSNNLAASWLASQDAWSPSLARLIFDGYIHYSGVQLTAAGDGGHHPRRTIQKEDEVFPGSVFIAEHGLGLLGRLMEKGKPAGRVRLWIGGLRTNNHNKKSNSNSINGVADDDDTDMHIDETDVLEGLGKEAIAADSIRPKTRNLLKALRMLSPGDKNLGSQAREAEVFGQLCRIEALEL